jgi:hypothetical protein
MSETSVASPRAVDPNNDKPATGGMTEADPSADPGSRTNGNERLARSRQDYLLSQPARRPWHSTDPRPLDALAISSS